MTIIVDTQEPEKILKAMEKLSDEVKSQKLPVGDFLHVEKDICIERKEISDFIGSIQSGHIQKQLIQMKKNHKHNYLIISGSLKNWAFANAKAYNRRTPWTVEHHLGAIASCAVRYGISVITVENDSQLCKLAIKIFKKTEDGKTISIKNTELLKNSITAEDIKLKLLTCFEGIGIKKAEKILTENKEIQRTLNELIAFFQ